MTMDIQDLKSKIQPFFWIENGNNTSVCLNVGSYKSEIFQTREQDGFEGNGYDWASLAKVFVDEIKPELKSNIKFDPEAGMFCAYSSDRDALSIFILSFKEACEKETLILDLFSRAEID